MVGFAFQAPVAGEVVINEIHYDPDIKTELVEFIELYNPGSNAVELTSWALDEGIDFVFTNSTFIAPGGYLVVAENPAALQTKFGVTNALGPWTGRLARDGERVVLRDGSGEIVDEVSYQLGFPWPTVGDIPGHSIELVHPGLDNDLGGSWRSSTQGGAAIPGLTVIPRGSTWRFFKGKSEPSTPIGAWRAQGFDDSSWETEITPIGFGDPLIATVLDDMPTNYTSVYFRKEFVLDDPSVPDLVMDLLLDDGIKSWFNGIEFIDFNVGNREVPYNATATSSIEFDGYLTIPLGQISSILRRGTNVIAAQIHNASLANPDFAFDLALFTQPGIDPRGATPGTKNSVYAETLPPQVRQVSHSPEQPMTGQPVLITAKVSDPDGVERVELQYQVNLPGAYIELTDPEYQTNWVSIQMNDTGLAPDLTPGDAVYSAAVPGSVQRHRHLVRYRIIATDSDGQSVSAPHPDDPEPNFGYFVYDGVPAWSGAIQPRSTLPERSTPVTFGPQVLSSLPVYHLISKKESVRQAILPNGNEQYWGDQYNWKGTLVYDGKVYDHIGYRARGGSWRYSMGKNMWKFDFNRGHDFEPRDNYGRKYRVPWRKLNLGACIQQGDYQHRGEQGMFESVGFRLFNLAGIEAPETHFIHLRVVDEAEENHSTNQYVGDFWGLYLAIEQEDGRFLDQHGLPDGNFYKMESGTGELNNQGPTAPSDKSDLYQFMGGYQGPNPPESWWRQNFDLERYYSYQAIVQGIHHYDICAGKNYFYFSNPETGLWSVHPWDIDLTWANNMYDSGCGGTDEFRVRVLNKPGFKPEYQNSVREIRDLLFNTNQAWRLIDEYAAMIDDPAGGPSFVDADRAMWDYNPIMSDSRIVSSSKAGQGRFYQIVPTKDFPGMVKKMKNYVVTRGTLLDGLANDPLVPATPVIHSTTSAAFPVNRLVFECSSYSGTEPFAAMKWRLGEVTPPHRPAYDPRAPAKYEIETVWETPELDAFNPSLTIPGLAVEVGHTYRVRARMMDSTGRWSHWSDPVEFTVGPPEPTAPGPGSLRLSELMFDPAGGSEFEFIELHNPSDSNPIDLTGARFTQGLNFTFPTGTVVAPGEYLLVTPSTSAIQINTFRAHYGLATNVVVLGPFAGALNNDGETITLASAAGVELLSFNYGDGRGWPQSAGGAGHSLVPAESSGNPAGANLDYPASWRASSFRDGSPGRADPLPESGLVLNEIAANTGTLGDAGSNDWIELYNLSGAAVNFDGHWYLSDSPDDLRKWQIPAGTAVPAQGWIAFDELTGFHPAAGGFGLSKDGEQVFLSYLPGTSADRVVDAVRFEAQRPAQSIGRSPDGRGSWIGLAAPTRGAKNSTPAAQLVIHEVMFHPQATVAQPAENTADEFIEIYNPTGSPVSLFNTNGVWQLSGGITFAFPHNTVLGPGEILLVVSFNPVDATALSAFRSTYPSANTSRIVGPYVGRLDNSSDRLALEEPQFSTINSPPAWITVDEVIYSDRTPWPTAADGSGASIQRVSLIASGNEPSSWRSATPSPGSLNSGAVLDSDQDGMPDDWERSHNLNPNSAADASLDSDADGLSNLNEYRSGTNPADPASGLRLAAVASESGMALEFTAAAHKSYTISFCAELGSGVWQVLQTIPASATERVVQFEDAPTSDARYYRVELKSAF